jgi:hypothetical protein
VVHTEGQFIIAAVYAEFELDDGIDICLKADIIGNQVLLNAVALNLPCSTRSGKTVKASDV